MRGGPGGPGRRHLQPGGGGAPPGGMDGGADAGGNMVAGGSAFNDQDVATLIVVGDCGDCTEPLTPWTPNMPDYMNDLRDETPVDTFDVRFTGGGGNCEFEGGI